MTDHVKHLALVQAVADIKLTKHKPKIKSDNPVKNAAQRIEQIHKDKSQSDHQRRKNADHLIGFFLFDQAPGQWALRMGDEIFPVILVFIHEADQNEKQSNTKSSGNQPCPRKRLSREAMT